MAKSNTVSDAYLESIAAQINELDVLIEAAVPKKLLEKKANLEAIKTHYLKFKKEAAKNS